MISISKEYYTRFNSPFKLHETFITIQRFNPKFDTLGCIINADVFLGSFFLIHSLLFLNDVQTIRSRFRTTILCPVLQE